MLLYGCTAALVAHS